MLGFWDFPGSVGILASLAWLLGWCGLKGWGWGGVDGWKARDFACLLFLMLGFLFWRLGIGDWRLEVGVGDY